MTAIEDHLRYLEGGVEVLEDYLLSSEMYWAVGVSASEEGKALPRLTMGGLLLAWRLVKIKQLSQNQRERYERVTAQIEQIRDKWRVAWGRKCQRSFSIRLRAWRDFIEEYRAQPEEHFDRYSSIVRLRTMLQLLLFESSNIEETELGLLATLDRILRNILMPGNFIWESEQAEGFPPEEYWFLYGHLPKQIN